MHKKRGRVMRGIKLYMKATMVMIGLFMLVLNAVPNANAAGELNVGWSSGQMISSLQCNDAWQYEALGCMVWQLLYDQVWTYGPPPEYNTVWRAVTGMETEDNKNFRFHIREGMTWHDGKPVTAEDFAFTYKYLPTSNPVWAFDSATTVEGSVVAVDDYTLDFELANPLPPKYPPFDWFPTLPKHQWKRYKMRMAEFSNKKAIGSGPFMLDEFSASNFISFKNYEGYWEKNPRVDRIVFKTYGGEDALNMAIKRGEIDMMGYGGVSALSAKMLKNADGIELITSDGIGYTWFSFNMYPDGPMKDLAVRKAIVHAVDKDRIIKMIYHGQAVAHDSFIYPEMTEEYNTNLPQYDYNIDTANKLMEEAGYTDTDGDGLRNDPNHAEKRNINFKFLVASSSADDVKLASLMREELKKVGIGIKIVVVDIDTYYDMVYEPMNPTWDISIVGEEPGPYAGWIWEFMRSWNDEASMAGTRHIMIVPSSTQY